MLWWAACVMVSTLVGYHAMPMSTKQCTRAPGGILSVEVTVEIPADFTYLYVTFLDDAGTEKVDTCSNTNGQITGTGVAGDPFTIKIDVDSNATPDIGAPDCGHSRVGEVYTWRLSTVTMLAPPLGLPTPNIAVTQDVMCDYATITEGVSAGAGVNGTTTEVTLTYTSIALEMSLVKTDFTAFTEDKALGDIARLSIKAIGSTTGLYMYGCEACENAVCGGGLVFPLLDANGCESSNFGLILNPASSAETAGSFMEITVPNTSFTRGFRLFRFAGSNDVFIRCNVGYCLDAGDPLCSDHCATVTTARRKRQTSSTKKEYMTYYIKIEGTDTSLIVGSPSKWYYRNSTAMNSKPEAEPCLEKVEFIVVLGIMGTAVVASGVMATFLTLKLSNS